MSQEEIVPQPGEWPVDPQEDQSVLKERIWVDGCFDFSHHGHAGAMLQARRLGGELYVGIHSDEAILENKGPTVMNLKERVAAVDACRWTTRSIPHAPYVTSLAWISHYGCYYVGHGDDITSDSTGEDCYRHVKKAGRFLVFKRTPGISTTDLVGRMLLCTKGHFIKSLTGMLDGQEGSGSDEERKQLGEQMRARMEDYATDETASRPGVDVWSWHADGSAKDVQQDEEPGTFSKSIAGKGPRPGQRVVYVDGGFDIFSSGHIEFLHQVTLAEEKSAKARSWYSEEAKQARIKDCGEDYPPLFLVAGIHDDEVINHWKGANYPIMNIFERGLCVLQCKYIHAVVFSAPFTPSKTYLQSLPYGVPSAVCHGPTSFMPLTYDPYVAAKKLGIFKEISSHDFQHVNAGEVVERIMKSRAMYEERQRLKGEKAIGEDAVLRREKLEAEAAEKRKTESAA